MEQRDKNGILILGRNHAKAKQTKNAFEVPSASNCLVGRKVDGTCVFCKCSYTKRECAITRHHIVPECTGGTDTVAACVSCHLFIHQTWSIAELAERLDTVEKLLSESKMIEFITRKISGELEDHGERIAEFCGW